jgi:glycerate dehydrogenase
MVTPASSPPESPRIVVLDGHTLNPGDLDWGPLLALGRCDIHARSAPEEILARAAGAQVLLTNKTPLARATIEALPELRYVGVLATGTNIVDLGAARERAIAVTNVPGYGTPAVAQATFALLLELANRTGHHAQTVREGRWCASPDFCYWDVPLVELGGLTMGIVGYGAIGRAVSRIARAFEMRVLVTTRHLLPEREGVKRVALDDLFRHSDVVSLHCPLTEETRGIVNTRRLALMKPSAFLINTGRGALVVESDLAQALDEGRIAGAGLDVLCVEPPMRGNPLLAARNCVVTPHIAWATRAARARLLDTAIGNLRSFLSGNPRNVVGN